MILVFLFLFVVSGCASNNDKEMDTDTQNEESISEEVTISDLLDNNEIPVPSSAKIKDSTIVITGKNPDEIMEEYRSLLTNSGWNFVTATGMKHYYEKTITEKTITISVFSAQEGGLQSSDIDTTIQLEIEEVPYSEDKTTLNNKNNFNLRVNFMEGIIYRG